MITEILSFWGFWMVGGFLLGSIMFSRLLPLWIKKKDICQLSADRNPGAANVFINCGIPMGIACLALDFGKGFLPVFAASRLLGTTELWFAAVMAAPVLGHAIAPFQRINGGKCIATAFGVLAALLPNSPAVWILAGLYIVIAAMRFIPSNRCRSIITFCLFGVISVWMQLALGEQAIALGCLLIAVIAVVKHLRRFGALPEKEQAAKETAAKNDT